jgi:signal transduction histidine kinase
MHIHLLKSVACAAVLAAGVAIFATTGLRQINRRATIADAKATLENTVVALKANKTKTLDEINNAQIGLLKDDIYPFCFNLSDGLNVAVANRDAKPLIGTDIRSLRDATGDAYGQRIYDAAKEGQVNQVSYKFPKPGPDKTPVPKVSFVTAVAGLGCGVGYYL